MLNLRRRSFVSRLSVCYARSPCQVVFASFFNCFFQCFQKRLWSFLLNSHPTIDAFLMSVFELALNLCVKLILSGLNRLSQRAAAAAAVVSTFKFPLAQQATKIARKYLCHDCHHFLTDMNLPRFALSHMCGSNVPLKLLMFHNVVQFVSDHSLCNTRVPCLIF